MGGHTTVFRKNENIKMKIKTYLRRIIFFPFLVPFIPLVWLFGGESMKEIWESILDLTDEETDGYFGEI